MSEHPSMDGLREAVTRELFRDGGVMTWLVGTAQGTKADPDAQVAKVATHAIATYLKQHGVGWFGDGLVRAKEHGVITERVELAPPANTVTGAPALTFPFPFVREVDKAYRLVPVPDTERTD